MSAWILHQHCQGKQEHVSRHRVAQHLWGTYCEKKMFPKKKMGGCEIYPAQLTDQVRNDLSRRAEVMVYDRLKEQLGAGWLVIYSAPFLAEGQNGDLYDGEADFVISHGTFGTLFVEVKGGEIEVQGGEWRTITLRSKRVNPIQNPETQVRRNKWSVVEKLAKLGEFSKLPSPREEIKRHVCQSVCFPDVARPKKDIAANVPLEIVISGDDLDQFEQRISNILSKGCKPVPNSPYRQLVQNGIRQLFAAHIRLRHPLRLSAKEDERLLVSLSHQQYDVLFSLNFRTRAAVIGCAGSGKTFLAAHHARLMAEHGQRTLLTCFNQSLAEYLKANVEPHPNLEILRVNQLCGIVANKAGLALDSNAEDLYTRQLPEALSAGMRKCPELKYDCILMDEAQDVSHAIDDIGDSADKEEQKQLLWMALEDCLKDENSSFYAFFDTHQALYGDAFVPKEYFPPLPLTHNVRNTQSICDIVRKHYRGEVPLKSRGPTGACVQTSSYSDKKQLHKAIEDKLRQLIVSEQFSNTDIVVLTPYGSEKSMLDGKIGEYQLVRREPKTNKEIRISSIRGFKGLERRVVIVAELDEAFSQWADFEKECYVAFSRPMVLLVVMAPSDCMNKLVQVESEAVV